jgi:MoaA/NifB/PqqE/SkfB family radical SAM enzyme
MTTAPKSKAISWNICRQCNYNCTYCAQGKDHTGFPSPEDLAKLKDFFCNLGQGWEIKISGGEPFLCPDFLDIIHSLKKAGIKISVVTNFSFPEPVYKKFLTIAGPYLRSFSVSLHREKTGWRDFLKKSIRIKKKIAKTKKGSFVVNSVVEPGKAHELTGIKNAFKEKGIRFYPQLMRVKGRTVDYNREEQAVILKLAEDKDPFKINAGYSLKGKTCYAGTNYFVVTPEGKCYSCYPGKRDESGYMGSIIAGDFKFREQPALCPYDVCPCTVPINRGIVVYEMT